ncbi:MFS transporter protein [Rutstroemia sp. NJR-2017a BVV2]|nr:MFS transporter protein [Rutstroemia sp. NJR-2017a BVV2]
MTEKLEGLEATADPSITKPAGESFYIVTFDGDDDSQNPLNWPRSRKWAMVGVLSSASLVAILGTGMCIPPSSQILSSLKSHHEIFLTLLVSVWELGEACGPLFIGPLSEMYGRVPVYHTTNVLFTIFSIACAVSRNIDMLLAFRFLNGMGVAAISLNSSVVGDMFIQEERAGVQALINLPALTGLAIAPLIGGYVGETLGWRWVFWLGAIVGGLCELGFILFFRESYKVTILEQKASKKRLATGDPKFRSIYASETKSSRQLFAEAIVRPAKILVLSPIVLVMSIYGAIVFGFQYLVMTTMTVVFEENYNMSEGTAGLMYLGRGIGSTIAILACRFTMDRYIQKKKITPGGMKPEHRLPPMIIGSICMPLGFFLYGWSAEYKLPWIVPVLGTALIAGSLSVTNISLYSYLVDAFSIYAASAVSACVVLSCIAAALLPMAGPSLYAHLGVGWGTSVLAFISMAFIPVPIFLMRYGQRARSHSKFQVIE